MSADLSRAEIPADPPPGAVVVHPPHGFVALIEHRASDLDVVNAARVSHGRRSESMSDDDRGLLRYLLRERHGSPFEHTHFTFHVRAPIFVLREWHRHRIGVSINEESGRYVELRPDFYVPAATHVRTQTGRAGRYGYETDPGLHPPAVAEMTHAFASARAAYRELLDMGVAKELARTVLPVATYSQMYWTCNARSLMAFLSLRNHERAQREIRDYAEALEGFLEAAMPVTHDQFVKQGRTAP